MKGIYVHIPFCKKKCNYCDFCSYPSLISKQDEYCNSLIKEANLYKNNGIMADTVYFGGGTPTLLSPDNIKRIADSIFASFNVMPNAEITIEANPCTVTGALARGLKSAGFNRVSLGAQSFSDLELSSLGRLHTSSDTEKSFKFLRDAGFSNISLDLMYAIPEQTMDTLSTSINRVLNLSPEHISCYGLKIEENTPFDVMLSRGEIAEKSDDEYADMYDLICKKLTGAGYVQYELSNFSKPGYESRHNLKYWQAEEYVGLGASAASFYNDERYTRTSDLSSYMTNFENAEKYSLSKEDKMSEFMFLSLRLTSLGASKAEFEKRFSKKIEEVFADAIKKHTKSGMLLDLGDRYVLSSKAYYISNSVLCDFV